jgi:thiamine pyrophosphate-dependent acetolactate synthase large subunit-like protein
MSYTLSEAAKATGKSKMTLLRAIKNGRMSARRKDDNSYEIDPAELHRVFPPTSECDGDTDNTLRHDMPEDTSLLRLKLESALEKIEALDTERERERRDAQATIDDLRRRLDQEAEERRRLTLMLTDQREHPSTAPQEAVQGRFVRAWGILRGKV